MIWQSRQRLWLLATTAVLAAVGCTQQWQNQAPMAERHSQHGSTANATMVDQAIAATETMPAPKTPANPAEPDAERGTVRIVVISDLNSAYGSTSYEPEVTQAIALIPSWEPDLVLAGGDMVAGQKRSLSNAQMQAMWDAFDEAVRQPLDVAGIPFGFTIGNHDGSGAKRNGELAFARDRAFAEGYWNGVNPDLPFVDRAQFPFYYSFSQQDVLYLVWDASTAELGATQLAWVEAQLSSDLAQQAKARIVIGHLPLYPVAVKRDRPGEFLNNAEQLQQLLEKYDVHTYISGHNHAYYPGQRGELELLYTGALGGGPRQLLGSNAEPFKALTVLDLFLEDKATSEQTQGATVRKTYQTYRLPEMTPVDAQALPAQIISEYGTVQRQPTP